MHLSRTNCIVVYQLFACPGRIVSWCTNCLYWHTPVRDELHTLCTNCSPNQIRANFWLTTRLPTLTYPHPYASNYTNFTHPGWLVPLCQGLPSDWLQERRPLPTLIYMFPITPILHAPESNQLVPMANITYLLTYPLEIHKCRNPRSLDCSCCSGWPATVQEEL